MRLLLVGQSADGSNIVYGVSENGETLVEVIGTSEGLLSPSEIVCLCKEHTCKLTPEHYFTYVCLYIRSLTDNQHVAWTREAVNYVVAMLFDEEYDGSLAEVLDSDNFPLQEDLMEVLADADTYRIVPKGE